MRRIALFVGSIIHDGIDGNLIQIKFAAAQCGRD